MSNLLQPKKKPLLNRGPKIEPETSFSLNDLQEENVEQETDVVEVIEETKTKKPGRPKVVRGDQVTSVRIMKSTRSKLNALVQIGRAENVDLLIDAIVEEYIEASLTKDEKRIYKVIYDTYKNR